MQLDNQSPFRMDRVVALDRRGAEQLIVLVKATYDIGEGGQLRVTDEQAPVEPADRFAGAPGASSIVAEAELEPPKLATDVFLFADAVAPREEPVTELDVTLRVGPIHKTVRVTGNRAWAARSGPGCIGPAEPFVRMLLSWAHAYGGRDTSPEDPAHHGQEPLNPIGRGHLAPGSRRDVVGTLLANLEDPYDPITRAEQRVRPVGFGPIGRDWQPRIAYAGTYDGRWIAERAPLLPDDFDPRFHSAAPPDQIARGYLTGGEVVTVEGCTARRPLACTLPTAVPEAVIVLPDRDVPLALPCNTVTIDVPNRQLRLLYKGAIDVHRKLLRVRTLRVTTRGGAP